MITNKLFLRNKYKALFIKSFITMIYIIKYIYANLSAVVTNAASINKYLSVIMGG